MKAILLVLIILTSFSCAGPQHSTPVEVQNLSAQEYKRQRMSGKTMVVDVRTPEEFADGHLTGAINSDYRGGDFAEEIKTWKKNKVYYLYCASGNRSGKAAELMKEAGFQNIYNIGGFQTLREAGLPTEQGVDE
ncbi:rhodanese-like domain-containing protein [Pontibacter diazotrophicus]|uniref:Rhodanese-like domain-containing protein n=1 Tax=Pontibacter diazotrophicus TaxID=1400979 RepID=A0A3D8LEZ4_9BACT|nr:rhodanese-like domain-containing protein [Pontibacter diazotrophicus]RDV16011.1 rhodanese-like domain-containing protein [Pontibacter diazotrophicus]